MGDGKVYYGQLFVENQKAFIEADDKVEAACRFVQKSIEY